MTESRMAGPPSGHFLRILFLLAGAIALLLGLTACDSGTAGPAASPSQPAGTAGGNGPRLNFTETRRDFGQINYSSPMEYRWPFTNAGNAPLQVSDVKPEPLDPTT